NEMDERFSALKRAVKDTSEALKNAPTPYGEHMQKLQARVDELLSHTDFEQKRREFAKSLKKGDQVFVISLNGTGTITRIHKERGQLTVQVGILPIETTFDNISWIEGRGAAAPRQAPPRPAGGERHQGGREAGERGERGGERGPRGGRFERRGARESELSPGQPYNVLGSGGADMSGPPGAFGSTGVKPMQGGRGGPRGGR